MMDGMTFEEFEEVVQEALELIPKRFMEALDNVSIVIEEEPTEYDLRAGEESGGHSGTIVDDELLGLYDGVNIMERADFYELDAPDMITIFKGPHERLFPDREVMVEEIQKTVIHEIGHYFGLDDERLYEMGY